MSFYSYPYYHFIIMGQTIFTMCVGDCSTDESELQRRRKVRKRSSCIKFKTQSPIQRIIISYSDTDDSYLTDNESDINEKDRYLFPSYGTYKCIDGSFYKLLSISLNKTQCKGKHIVTYQEENPTDKFNRNPLLSCTLEYFNGKIKAGNKIIKRFTLMAPEVTSS